MNSFLISFLLLISHLQVFSTWRILFISRLKSRPAHISHPQKKSVPITPNKNVLSCTWTRSSSKKTWVWIGGMAEGSFRPWGWRTQVGCMVVRDPHHYSPSAILLKYLKKKDKVLQHRLLVSCLQSSCTVDAKHCLLGALRILWLRTLWFHAEQATSSRELTIPRETFNQGKMRIHGWIA